jgi:hypothetical protein
VRLTTGQKLALAGATALKVAIVARWYTRRKARRAAVASPSEVGTGQTVCPVEAGRTPASASGLRAGDHVALVLGKGGLHQEATWARVLTVGTKTTTVEIEGELEGHGGVKPLKSGFAVGDKLMVGLGCIWDVLRASAPTLCGDQGAAVVGHARYEGTVSLGDLVQAVLNLGHGFFPTWAKVVRMSSTGSVLTVEPVDVKGMSVDITRDCVYEVHR